MARSSLACSSSSPMNKLPEELLSAVLQRVRNTSSPASFVLCLLCCRRWCDMGLPLLCDVMLLRNSNIEPFLSRFPSANCPLIRSLTITIEPEIPATFSWDWIMEDVEHVKRNESAETKTLMGRLEGLAIMISKMTTLSILSFGMTRDSKWTVGSWIPKSIIASMVENLSKSCVNLEIDTNGYDCLGPSSISSLRQDSTCSSTIATFSCKAGHTLFSNVLRRL